MFDSAPANLPFEPAPKPPAQPQAAQPAPAAVPSAAINVTGTKEPEDIFADIKEPSAQASVAAAPSAAPPMGPSRSGAKIALAIIIPVAVLGLGVGGWWVYANYFSSKPTLNLPVKNEQPVVTPVTSAPNEIPEPNNPFPKPDEDQMAAAQATISMMQNQAAQEQALSQLPPTSTYAMPELPEIPASATDASATPAEAPIQQPATTVNPAIPTPEVAYAKTLDAGKDTDEDGLTDAEELALGTDMLKSDTDGDGFADGSEVKSGYDPLTKGAKLDVSKAFKHETVGQAVVWVPASWAREPGLGGAVTFKTGTPATINLTLQTFASGASLLEWIVAQNPGTMADDYRSAKNAMGNDVVYSKDGMTAWLLQGNTVVIFRYATNGSPFKDFGTIFETIVNRAQTAQ